MECGKCATTIDDDEWFCSYCGTKRERCPQCGTEYTEASGQKGEPSRECPSCGVPRKAACTECEELIDATATVCPNCGTDAGEEARNRIGKNKKRAVAFGLGIPIVGWLVLSGLPSILTWLLWVPLVLMGVVSGFWYRQKMKVNQSKLQSVSPAKFDLAEEQHESYNHRQKRKEEERKQKEFNKKLEKEMERERRTDLEMNCPECGQPWTIIESQVGDWNHVEGIEILKVENFGELEVQCSDCNHIRNVQVG